MNDHNLYQSEVHGRIGIMRYRATQRTMENTQYYIYAIGAIIMCLL